MISDEVKQQLHAIRTGEVRLPLTGHVVILNWNAQALSLLKQLSHAQSDCHSRLYKRPIVVLAEPSKASLDAALAAVFKRDNRHLRLFCRSGRPAKARDLEGVAAEAADTVIVLHPDSCSSKAAADALKATALVSLACLRERALGRTPPSPSTVCSSVGACAGAACRVASTVWAKAAAVLIGGKPSCATSSSGGSSRMRIVVQMASNSSTTSASSCSPPGGVIGFLQDATAGSLCSGTIQQVQLLSQSTLDRLVCQTAAEPGVATVFRELVRAGGDVHLDWCLVTEQLATTYGGAAEMLQGCVLLGVQSAESQQLTLNPPDHLMLQPGDRLVALTRQQGITPCLPASSGRSRQRPINRSVSRMSSMSSPLLGGGLGAGTGSDGSTSSPPKGSRAAAAAAADRGKQVIVLGWPEAAVPDLLLQLQEAMRGGGHVTVVVPAQAEQQLVSNASAKQLLKQAGSAKVQQGAGMWHVQYVRVPDPSSTQTLLDAGIADADAVILGSALSAAVAPASTEADALVTAAILAVQQALQTAKGATSTQQQQQQLEVAAGSGVSQQQPPSKLHVVAVVSSYSVRRALQTFLSSVLLQCSFSYEIMVLDEFAAGMLVSVALDVSNSLVIDQLLLQPRASPLGMWTLQKLGLDPTGQQLTFQEVCQAARRCRCTALGYRRSDGRMVLVPSPGLAKLTAEDRVVVLARAS